MNENRTPTESTFKRSRYGFATLQILSWVLVWMVFRLVLYAAFRPQPFSSGEALMAILAGALRDVLVASVLTLPLLGWMFVIPNSWRVCKWHRRVFWLGYFIFLFVMTFSLFVEFFFFDEFKSRFNT